MQQIVVLDENGVKIGSTFVRRAKQLILKQRAAWLDDTCAAIRLLKKESEEVYVMDKTINLSNQNYHEDDLPPSEPSSLYEADSLLLLAKKRVKEKMDLLKFIAVYIIAWSAFIIINRTLYNRWMEGFCWGILLTTGVLLFYRITLFLWYNFRRYDRDPIEVEYEKLRRMAPERIAKEYSRL